MQLTEAGQVFLQEAYQLFAQLSKAIDLTQRTGRGEKGQLRVGFTSLVTYDLLPVILRRFREQFLEVELVLQELTTTQQEEALFNRRIHVGFAHPPLEDNTLNQECIQQEGLIVALLETHFLARQENISVREPRDENFIMFPRHLGPGLYDQIVSLCQQGNFSPKVTQEAIQMQTIIGLVSAGMGIAIARQLIGNNQLIFSYNQKLTTNRNLGYVHSKIKFRGNTDQNISYINQDSAEEFEESSASSALREVYPGAIYLAQDFDGNPVQYKSQELNLTEGKAILKPIEATNLFSRPEGSLNFEEIKILGEANIINLSQGAARFTPVSAKIKEEIYGYNLYRLEQKWTCTNNRCRNFNFNLPGHIQTCPACNTQLIEREFVELLEENKYKEAFALNYNTFCVRVEINDNARNYFSAIVKNLRKEIFNKQKYISNEEKQLFESNETQICVHTLAHQLMLSLPLVEHGANSRDIDFMLIEVPSNHNIVGYFFDTCEHGTGMCDTLIKYLEITFIKAKFLVDNCPCKYGCSSCTTIQRCPDDNKALFKSVGLSLLEEIINPTQTRTINQ